MAAMRLSLHNTFLSLTLRLAEHQFSVQHVNGNAKQGHALPLCTYGGQ